MGYGSDLLKEAIPPEARWKWIMFVWSVANTLALAVVLDFTPVTWGPIAKNTEAIAEIGTEMAGLKETLLCSNLKRDIENNRGELYAIEREIEVAAGNVTERVLMRRQQLRDTLRDNELRFTRLGCLERLA